jgi:hypothetical protein
MASPLEAAEQAIKDSLRAYVEQLVDPAAILGQLRSGADLPLGIGSKVATWQETLNAINAATTPSAIAGALKNADGDPLSPGTRVLSKSQVTALIQLMLCEAGAGGGAGGAVNGVTGVSWDQNRNTLTISVSDGTTPNDYQIDFSDFVKNGPPSVSTPALDMASQALPLAIYGTANVLMGGPDAFESRDINGTKYLVPLYLAPGPS